MRFCCATLCGIPHEPCSTANAKALQFGMTHIITNLFLKMSSRAVGNGEAMTRRRGIPYSQRTTLKIQPISVGEGLAPPVKNENTPRTKCLYASDIF